MENVILTQVYVIQIIHWMFDSMFLVQSLKTFSGISSMQR